MSALGRIRGEVPEYAALIVGELLGLKPRRRIKPDYPFVQQLVQYSRGHRLLPLIIERLRNIVLDPESEALVQSIRADLAQRSLQLAAEMVRVRSELHAASIPSLPFKGPPLAQRLWGDVALRSMGDLDLVIHAGDAFKAHRIMLDGGYRPKVAVLPHQEKAFLRYEHDRAYTRGDDGMVVELHWRLFDRYIAFQLTDEELWGGLDENGIGEILPEVETIILALHGAKHAWTSAGWVVDIAAMLTRMDLDERILLQLARATGTARVLRLAYALASAYAGVRLTETMEKQIADDPIAMALCRATIEGPLSREREGADRVDNAEYYLRTRERAIHRLHYRWYWTLTPNIDDQNAFRVPSMLSWVNYPVRVLRLLRKGWTAVRS